MMPVKTLGTAVLLQCAALLTLSASAAFAGNVGLNVNVNIGEPPRQVVVAPAPPVYVAPPVYAPPAERIPVDEDIQFVYPDNLGFYVAVGIPYDLFYVGNSYFLFRDGRWFRSPGGRGPWVAQSYRELPRSLRRHRLERIREFRNREYVIYNRDREHYRGRQFRSDREQWREHREAKERREDEKRFIKEQRKEDKRLDKEERRLEKEQRKDEKRFEKEERHERRDRHGD